ncbi:ATP-binding protein [Vibrio stylophorae]|nr:ATP-binding protein [Vibrio stylophorae]
MGVIILAQLLAATIWYQHSSQREQEGLVTTVRSLALSAASTISFFSALPPEYRHLVLNQLRSMGGTRFFVSLNDHEIPVQPLPNSERKTLVLDEVANVLKEELGDTSQIQLEFTQRDQLKVFNKEISIDALPLMWAHYSLSYGEINPPILVMQIEVAPQQWFYLAAVLPAPYVQLETPLISHKEILSLLLSGLLLMSVTWWLVRKELQPLKNLAKAATLMSSRLKVPEVKEQGSAELIAAIRAFNKMNRRINAHMHERDMLFGAISHDLKTPIACLKLRIEMLDDEQERIKLQRIVSDLELMVKGALQCIVETDIHEEIEAIDLNQLLTHCQLAFEQKVQINGQIQTPFIGKPLAIKRAISNLIHNAVKYGERAYISLHETEDRIILTVTDDGPPINCERLNQWFAPYYRDQSTMHHEGHGLGLTISKSIAKAHGGDLLLSQSSSGGLAATLYFVRD